MRHLSRRAALALGAGSAAITLIGWNGGAFATPQAATDDIAKFTGGATPEKGKISIVLPEIAENGNTVPLTVSVDSPKTAENHVKSIHVFNEKNPQPNVANFYLGPNAARAQVSTRIIWSR